jgi:hypothetical protein
LTGVLMVSWVMTADRSAAAPLDECSNAAFSALCAASGLAGDVVIDGGDTTSTKPKTTTSTKPPETTTSTKPKTTTSTKPPETTTTTKPTTTTSTKPPETTTSTKPPETTTTSSPTTTAPTTIPSTTVPPTSLPPTITEPPATTVPGGPTTIVPERPRGRGLAPTVLSQPRPPELPYTGVEMIVLIGGGMAIAAGGAAMLLAQHPQFPDLGLAGIGEGRHALRERQPARRLVRGAARSVYRRRGRHRDG